MASPATQLTLIDEAPTGVKDVQLVPTRVGRESQQSLVAEAIAGLLYAATHASGETYVALPVADKEHYRKAAYLLIRRETEAAKAFARQQAATAVLDKLNRLTKVIIGPIQYADALECVQIVIDRYERHLTNGPLPVTVTEAMDAAYASGIQRDDTSTIDPEGRY